MPRVQMLPCGQLPLELDSLLWTAMPGLLAQAPGIGTGAGGSGMEGDMEGDMEVDMEGDMEVANATQASPMRRVQRLACGQLPLELDSRFEVAMPVLLAEAPGIATPGIGTGSTDARSRRRPHGRERVSS